MTVPRRSASSGNSRSFLNLVTQKSAKKKAKKAAKRAGEQSVLGSLRSTRPTRIGTERRGSARRSTAAATTTATSKPAATKAKPKSAAKPKAGKATVRPTKPVAPGPKPAATRIPPPPDGRQSGPPRGTEIVTTAVQAAGELAQIGATVGAQLLKRAARRIPRP
jgi:hypothetical protein